MPLVPVVLGLAADVHLAGECRTQHRRATSFNPTKATFYLPYLSATRILH
jgi:hypothetical protein